MVRKYLSIKVTLEQTSELKEGTNDVYISGKRISTVKRKRKCKNPRENMLNIFQKSLENITLKHIKIKIKESKHIHYRTIKL